MVKKKFFIGYKNDKEVNLLCKKLPEMDGYVNSFEETKYHVFVSVIVINLVCKTNKDHY